jgi:hypothetical protein
MLGPSMPVITGIAPEDSGDQVFFLIMHKARMWPRELNVGLQAAMGNTCTLT